MSLKRKVLWVLGVWLQKTLHWWANGCGIFPWNLTFYNIKWLRTNMIYILWVRMLGLPVMQLTKALGNSFHKFVLLSFLACNVRDGSHPYFREDPWLEDIPFSNHFLYLYCLSTFYIVAISIFVHKKCSNISWNFHFFKNLNNRESFELLILTNMLDSLHFSFLLDKCTWSLKTFVPHMCTSFFDLFDKNHVN